MTDQSAQRSKRNSQEKNQLSTAMLLTIDLVSFILTLMPSVAAFSITGLFLYYGFSKTWLVLPLAPLVLLAVFILIIYLIRISLPRLKPGRYKRGLNKEMFAWFCHFALTRSAKIVGLISLLQSFNITKFLYWRALGVKASFQIMSSYDIDFVDCPLITIGKNVTLGGEMSICCHSDVGNMLLLAPVVIEDNVFIGMSTVVGPGTTIKKNAWIGFNNSFVNQVVEENARFGNVRPTAD